jgi:hypothetical protein
MDGVLQKIDVVDDSLFGRFCVIKYDGLPYPGTILDVDDDAVVKVMCRIVSFGIYLKIGCGMIKLIW